MSTNTTKGKRPIRPPFPLFKKFPTSFERATYKLYNSLDNRLWPVRPLYFSVGVLAAGAVHYKLPDNVIMNTLPTFNNDYAELAKLCVVALSTVYIPIVLLRQFLKRFYFTYKGYLFENPKSPSLTTKIWGALRSVLSLSPPLLKSCDVLLPSPSVPDLDDTIKRYLDSVKNLMSDDEFLLVKEQAEQFVREEGRKLHNYARLMSMFSDNYITPFWEKYAYLYSRAPLLINSSVAHTDLLKDKPATWAHRAAHVIYIEALSQLAIDRQTFKPLGDGLLCARHYEKMYAVTRVPEEQCDRLKNYGISKHIVLLYLGNLYRIQVCDEKNNIYTIEQLAKIFAELINRPSAIEGANTGASGRVAALTADKRDTWAQNRRRFFLDSPVNRASLHEIESAIFFMIYDENDSYDYNPENPDIYSNFLKNMLTGNGANRWCDKSLNYICAKNTRCGGTTEHSIADGSEFDHIMENFTYMDTQVLKYPSIEEQQAAEVLSESDRKSLILAKQLPLEVNQEMASEIERCMEAQVQAGNDVDMAATAFRDFGKGRIKKCGLSPDAFVQMAIQLANHRDQGKFVLTYEPASARFYKFSRTETLRTVSDASCAFVRAMLDEKKSRQDRIALLRAACTLHGLRNRECMVGKGIDRHLFVLFVLAKGSGVSSAFLDHYIQQPWLLSTSHVPNCTNQVDEDAEVDNTWMGASFAAVAKNGYGICYRFGGNHSILAHITSYHSAENTDSSRFRAHFCQALHDIADLFDEEKQ